MPNIALLNYCNLKCPYCFANTFIEDKDKQLITIEQLDKILNFIIQTPIDRIGLIGGEPTLHPQFKEILLHTISFCESHQTQYMPVVFTNGIELEKYSKFFKKAHALINLNEPEIVGQEKWEKINNSLQKLDMLGAMEKNITFGINLYPNIKNYYYIFDIAKKYGKKFIRCSYTAPACQFITTNKEEYYSQGKTLFLNFLEEAAKNNILIHMDCNKIPLCYFDNKEQEFILKNCDNYTSWCKPVLDITPDFKAVSCFGTYNLIDLNKFNNLNEVERYANIKYMDPKRLKNQTGKCLNCPKAENLTCQGGCLSFVQN